MLTWLMEVLPVILAVPILTLICRRNKLTHLHCFLIFSHALILMTGGQYTYARVPSGILAEGPVRFAPESLRPDRSHGGPPLFWGKGRMRFRAHGAIPGTPGGMYSCRSSDFRRSLHCRVTDTSASLSIIALRSYRRCERAHLIKNHFPSTTDRSWREDLSPSDPDQSSRPC